MGVGQGFAGDVGEGCCIGGIAPIESAVMTERGIDTLKDKV